MACLSHRGLSLSCRSLFSSLGHRDGAGTRLASAVGVDCVKAGKVEVVWNTMAGAANALGAEVAKKVKHRNYKWVK
jgi:hypothetical protein